ncbi:MAG: ATP-grasp domain-containing protein [bacterium]
MRNKITIGVTGLNSTESPAPGLSVMRCIREVSSWRGEGIGFGYDALDAGLYERHYFKYVYLLPYPSEGVDSLLDRILTIHKKTPIDVIIPNLDSEMYSFVSLEKRLIRHGIKTFLPTKEQLKMCSKITLAESDNISGIPLPLSSVVRDMKMVGKVEKIGFPLIVKGIFYEAYKAHNIDEVAKFIDKIKLKWGMPIILQKFIPGDEFNVSLVGDGMGNSKGFVCMRKLMLTDKGKAWSGITIRDEALNRLVERFIEGTKWRGPAELEILKSKDNGQFYLLEINPRFPAWIYLAKASGVNLPWQTVKLALGEMVKCIKDYKIGIIFSRYTKEHILDVKTLETINLKGEIYYGERTL